VLRLRVCEDVTNLGESAFPASTNLPRFGFREAIAPVSWRSSAFAPPKICGRGVPRSIESIAPLPLRLLFSGVGSVSSAFGGWSAQSAQSAVRLESVLRGLWITSCVTFAPDSQFQLMSTRLARNGVAMRRPSVSRRCLPGGHFSWRLECGAPGIDDWSHSWSGH
jgi:hypothetical protein